MNAIVREGVKFECTGCGACCTGPEGIVFFTPEEVARLADAQKISVQEIIRTYFIAYEEGYRALERSNGDCVFLEKEQCTIYDHRPLQCKTFPFWFQNMRNEKNWKETCERCPGIGLGKKYHEDEILEILHLDMDA